MSTPNTTPTVNTNQTFDNRKDIRKKIDMIDAREKEILNIMNDYEGEMSRLHHLRMAMVEEIEVITDRLNK